MLLISCLIISIFFLFSNVFLLVDILKSYSKKKAKDVTWEKVEKSCKEKRRRDVMNINNKHVIYNIINL